MSQFRRGALIALALLLTGLQTPLAAETAVVFAHENLATWRHESFSGETHYALVEEDGTTFLQARSEDAASALLREISVDLNKTPYINWRWRVSRTYGEGIDERSKSGDDYPARVYLVVRDGFLPWQVLAVNYVWSSRQPVGSHWPNAYTDRAMMLAVRSGDAGLGHWQEEKRNVREDFKRLFGRDIDSVDAVAIMVDSDNYHGSAHSDFGDIRFSED